MLKNNNIVSQKVENIRKDFFRDKLLGLVGKTNNKPIVVKGWFQYTGYLKQYCFRDVKLWIGDKEEARYLCQHINIKVRDINCTMEKSDDRQWFYLVGFPSSYTYFGIKKGCLRLVEWKGVPQIFSEEEYYQYRDKLQSTTYILYNFKKEGETRVRDICRTQ